MNMNLDDLERLLRNLMLSLGHASEMHPPRLGKRRPRTRVISTLRAQSWPISKPAALSPTPDEHHKA